ncbi:hypothetical protein [Conexibacter woesei]|uniref:hypothetical protein n=1 Tax=Conexibacter woesei TaxID=191495 RepID=UPI0018CA19C6|nr:hypothetical protein [Conexibacter woesei]
MTNDFTIDRELATRGAWTLSAAHGRGRDVELATSDRPGAGALAARLEALRTAPRRPSDLALALPIATGTEAASADGGARAWIARPVLTGPTLADRLAEGPLERNEALRVLSLVAGALDTLTAWDLRAPLPTPQRIGLARRSPAQPLLYDYGIPDDEVDLVADADYVAPEVAAGGPRTTASNVYALACVLVECLTGAPPFPYDMPALVLNAHRTEPPPRIAAATGLPDPLDRVLQTALDKRPEQRQQTPTGLMRAAQRALGHRRFPLPALAAPPAPRRAKTPQPSPRATAANPPRAAASPRAASPSRRRRSRWPAPSGVGVAAVLLLAGTAGYATATNGPDHRASAPPSGAAAAALASPRASASNDAPALGRAMTRLGAERAVARRQLRFARHPGAQAAAARRLAASYGAARAALPQPAALDAALADVQRAYHRLATTARTGDAAAFRHVTTKIAEREAALDTILRGIDANA